MWRLSHSYITTSGSKNKRKSEHLKTNKNRNATNKNLWDTAKAILRGTSIVIYAYIMKQERSQV